MGKGRTNNPRGKILVVGGGPTTFLSIIRSFGRKGFAVHTANDSTTDLALYSRYITKAHRISPSSHAVRRKSDIIQIMREEQFDLVIPVGDQNVIPFQMFRSEYESNGTVYLLDEHAFEVTNNKILTCQLARSLRIPIPRSEIISGSGDASSVLSGFAFPVMLKPASSYTPENLVEKSQVKRIDTLKQGEHYLKGMLLTGQVLVQEYFEGFGIGLELLAHEGRILTSFQHIRIHEEGKNIGSTYRKSQPVDEHFLSAAEKVITALHYSGVAMFEFRYNTDLNTWVLIEINGRFWGSLPLPLACGADFPWYLYQMLVEGRREFPATYRTGIYCRNTSADLQWITDTVFHNNFSKKRYSVFRYLFEFGNVLLLREKNDVFVLDDPSPGIRELSRLIREGVSRLHRKIRKRFVPVHAYTREHSPDVPLKVKNSHSILFVCYGNICRSPFAEAYLRKITPAGIQVSSCGYYPIADRVCPIDAIVAAQEYGIDLSAHRSRVINDEIIRNHDIIFIFDEKNFQEMNRRYPQIMSKVWFLSEVTGKEPVPIPDPYGRDPAVFEEVYKKIVENSTVIASLVSGSL
jgi:protein-tyrosine-phosphatase/predicted ATP-grasp superfamily ATP-dependent carboligase